MTVSGVRDRLASLDRWGSGPLASEPQLRRGDTSLSPNELARVPGPGEACGWLEGRDCHRAGLSSCWHLPSQVASRESPDGSLPGFPREAERCLLEGSQAGRPGLTGRTGLRARAGPHCWAAPSLP